MRLPIIFCLLMLIHESGFAAAGSWVDLLKTCSSVVCLKRTDSFYSLPKKYRQYFTRYASNLARVKLSVKKITDKKIKIKLPKKILFSNFRKMGCL